MSYSLVKVLLTVSSFRPSFQPQPRVYPQRFNFSGSSRRLSHVVSHYCELFVAAQKLNPFVIIKIQTLCAKYRGWAPANRRFSPATSHKSPVTHHALGRPFFSSTYKLPSLSLDLQVLYFHTITNCFFTKPFIFITICVALCYFQFR